MTAKKLPKVDDDLIEQGSLLALGIGTGITLYRAGEMLEDQYRRLNAIGGRTSIIGQIRARISEVFDG